MRNKPSGEIARSCFVGWPVALMTLLGMLGSSVAQAPEPVSVPFMLAQDHLVLVRGSIGPENDVSFLVDTGASCTYISRELARRLSLKGVEKTTFAYGRKVRTEQVILREFFLGATRFHTVPARVIRIAERLPQVGSQIDVIVGLNALMRTEFTIDYERKFLVFGPAPAFRESVPLDATREAIVARFEVDGRVLNMMFDTGAPLVLLYQRRLDGDVPGRRVPVEKTLHHLGAKESLGGVLLSGVRLGESRWDRLDAFLLDAPISGYEGLHGVLGPRSLELSRIHFDFRRNEVSWEREGTPSGAR